jgi:hypothetical protein
MGQNPSDNLTFFNAGNDFHTTMAIDARTRGPVDVGGWYAIGLDSLSIA